MYRRGHGESVFACASTLVRRGEYRAQTGIWRLLGFVSARTIKGRSSPDESEGCSPVSGGRTIRLCSLWQSDDLTTPLRPLVDTGAGDRGGASAKFSVVSETVGCRKGVDSVVLRQGGGGESNLRTQTKGPRPQISHLSVKSHSVIAPGPSFQPRVGSPVSPRMDTYPRGLTDSWTSNTPPC